MKGKEKFLPSGYLTGLSSYCLSGEILLILYLLRLQSTQKRFRSALVALIIDGRETNIDLIMT